MTGLVLSIALTINPGRIDSSDGVSMYEVARSIVDQGDVTIEHGVVWRGRDGGYYSPFGIGLSLLALLPYGAVAMIRHARPVPDQVAEGAVAMLTPVIVSLLAAAIYQLARVSGGSIRSALLVALGAVGGTFVLVYSKDFFSEPLVALLLVSSVGFATGKRPTASALALAAAAITRPQFLVLAPVWLWRIQRDHGWPTTSRSIIAFAGAAAVDVGYNVLRFDDPLNFGYSTAELHQGFTTPFLTGAGGLLFHPEKSVFLFAPLVVLIPFALISRWRTQRTAFWLLGANLVVTFVLSATWWAWGGGWVWGPRLLLPAVIPAIACIGPWADVRPARRTIVSVLIALGVLSNAPGAIVSVAAQLNDIPLASEGPRIIRQYELIPETTAYTASHLFDRAAQDGGRYLPFWQVLAAREWGVTGFITAMFITAMLLAGGLACALLLVRQVRQLTAATARVVPLTSQPAH